MDEPERYGDEETDAGAAPEPEVGGGFLVVFGRQLKALRLRAGLGRAEFGALVGYSSASIAAFEQGKRIPLPRFIDQSDEVLDAGGALSAAKDEVGRARYPAFFQDAAKLEAEAVELHVYANQAVPGLLQTPEYAQAVFGMWRPLLSNTVIEQRVAARVARQQIFERSPMPTISFVVEEVVMRRPIGGHGVWRGQLEQVLLCGHRRNVEIQVMPTERTEHAAMAGPFTLIETIRGQRIAYAETQGNSRLYSERRHVRELEEQYGILRAQALTPTESLDFVEKLLGER
ncbi:helix-turn-helix transcriptional regulator [Streptomyces sp. HNM0574]|uniref:helix-turn-helix domain-containing protein n=1 Tax=Streptomyces sp. HNM0574 TaxID=2714954 RepID=UPI00146BA6DB|nr:helix-turn-helix transcriptional regulator [Streptomyces sp. HNM0574]NLU66076.1 helix-turn-helix domain-containing protein [Streptomyces sp. HNM0574]